MTTVAKKSKNLTKREMAGKMLKFFGPTGKNWRAFTDASDAKQDGKCLTEAAATLFENKRFVLINEFQKRLGFENSDDLQHWNDAQKWPAIKRLVTSVRDGRKFNKAAAEALSK